ncbi:tRNA lysidine(34) synthetase TilS [Halalkalibacter akibai]|uniref:tRNA(Ile)-lysidine synthase n=1 Tax=Halalkalibacter akibai (strain ATCC 43226 / DSM 21942 / CIP 109018 / JCM 9157 / 1139) TaxID=1236973 RepID=W4R176_HALA3|nr:tRNA lysidine(34) synthetase TilS [Halalkalibacter akibai]GAE37309.1 tRNA(Ile)-lysidine synthetase [Halalkalibacter akibai JCM 9157]
MKADVLSFIQKHRLINRGDTVFVAVSGGPDSIALLHYLWSRKSVEEIEVIACHVNHQLRGQEADIDAMFVKEFCQKHDIDYLEKKVNVKEYAKEKQIGTQVAARELRYAWFAELLQTSNAKLATGHHGDDQVETMMMKMVRGIVPIHTYGIPIKRKLGNGLIIRPFLGITKAEIEQYCIEACIKPREDSSNHSRSYTRNRFRKEVMPLLKKENPNIHIHMQRQNEWGGDDETLLMQLAEDQLSNVLIKKSEQNVTISRTSLLNSSVALQRRVIHLILSYLYGENSPAITSIHIEQVLSILEHNKTSAELHLSNTLKVRRDYDLCHFSMGSMNRMEEQAQTLTIPGEVKFGDWTLTTSELENVHVNEGQHQLILDERIITQPLIIRGKQVHDRMECRGLEGTKKVSRLFIDRKISRQDRENWPLLVDGNGEVLWVPFVHKSKRAKVEAGCTKAIMVSCTRLKVD